VFHASSAMRTFLAAVSRVKGGTGGRGVIIGLPRQSCFFHVSSKAFKLSFARGVGLPAAGGLQKYSDIRSCDHCGLPDRSSVRHKLGEYRLAIQNRRAVKGVPPTDRQLRSLHPAPAYRWSLRYDSVSLSGAVPGFLLWAKPESGCPGGEASVSGSSPRKSCRKTSTPTAAASGACGSERIVRPGSLHRSASRLRSLPLRARV